MILGIPALLGRGECQTLTTLDWELQQQWLYGN